MKNKRLFSILLMALMPLLSACTAHSAAPTAAADIRNDVESLGVVNLKGDWIIPPLYQEIVYVKKINAFWVKERQSPDSANSWINTSKSTYWKLLDRNGRELKSELANEQSPLRQWPPPQALGVSVFENALPALSKDGAGLDEPNGRSLIPCIYHCMYDVGDGFWLAGKAQLEANNTAESVFPSVKLGNIRQMPPGLILFDSQGRKINTLPQGIFLPDGFFVDGILACTAAGGTCAIDKTGQVVLPIGSRIVASPAARKLRTGAPRSFNSFYQLPVSAAKPVKLIDIAKKSDLPSDIVPVPVAEGLALAPTQDELVGLINRKGEWIMPPQYNRLAYCDPDRLACSKGRLSIEQQKKQKLEITEPDIR